MTPAVCGLLIWALFLPGAWARGESLEDATQGPKTPAPLTLTSDHPAGYFPLDAKTLANAPPVLALTLTRVVNPGQTPFQVFVYLAYASRAGRTEPERILIGSFSLYPADRPAGFRLRSSTAFRSLKAAAPEPTNARLLLEIKRIHESTPWTIPVTVTVAPPEWRDEPRQ